MKTNLKTTLKQDSEAFNLSHEQVIQYLCITCYGDLKHDPHCEFLELGAGLGLGLTVAPWPLAQVTQAPNSLAA